MYYVPVVMADVIGGDDYSKFVAATETNAGAKATLDFYKFWSTAGRNDTELLIHAEAKQYDPDTESTPQFDACAIMVALELLDGENCEDRASLFEFDSVHFLESGEGEPFPAQPRAAFSLHGESDLDLPEQCPALTNYTFDSSKTPEYEMPVKVALGYTSVEGKASFYKSMAARMAGEKLECA